MASEFAGGDFSVRSVYVACCNKFQVKKNKGLLRELPDEKGRFDLLKELDLGHNLVGRKGVRPVIEVVRVCPNIEYLSFAQNSLDNDSISTIVSMLYEHPGVRSLNLDGNPISHAAGKLLSDFVGRRRQVVELGLERTLINPALVRIIEEKVRRNRAADASPPPHPARAQAPTPPPGGHPTRPAPAAAASAPSPERRSPDAAAAAAPAAPPAAAPAAPPDAAPAAPPAATGATPPPQEQATAPVSPEQAMQLLMELARSTPPPSTGQPPWSGLEVITRLVQGHGPCGLAPLGEGEGLRLLHDLCAGLAAPDTGMQPWFGLDALVKAYASECAGSTPPSAGTSPSARPPAGAANGAPAPAVAGSVYPTCKKVRAPQPAPRRPSTGDAPGGARPANGEFINMVFDMADDDEDATTEFLGLVALCDIAKSSLPQTVHSNLSRMVALPVSSSTAELRLTKGKHTSPPRRTHSAGGGPARSLLLFRGGQPGEVIDQLTLDVASGRIVCVCFAPVATMQGALDAQRSYRDLQLKMEPDPFPALSEDIRGIWPSDMLHCCCPDGFSAARAPARPSPESPVLQLADFVHDSGAETVGLWELDPGGQRAEAVVLPHVARVEFVLSELRLRFVPPAGEASEYNIARAGAIRVLRVISAYCPLAVVRGGGASTTLSAEQDTPRVEEELRVLSRELSPQGEGEAQEEHPLDVLFLACTSDAGLMGEAGALTCLQMAHKRTAHAGAR